MSAQELFRKVIEGIDTYGQVSFCPESPYKVVNLEFDIEDYHIEVEAGLVSRECEDERGKGFLFDRVNDISDITVYDENGDIVDIDRKYFIGYVRNLKTA